MAEVDAQAYAVTTGNAAAGASNSVETQQPGASGALRQVVVQGDATTRANMQTVKAASAAAVATDMASVVALHPSSPLPAGSNTIGALTANQSVNNAQVNGVTVLAGNGASGTGAQRVTVASDSTGQIAPAANSAATGASISYTAALVATKVAVNASAGNLYGYHIYNPNSVVIYVQLFNVASGSVTLGSTAPTSVLVVPALGWADAPPSGPPITYGTALTVAATTTASGSTAPTTGLVANFWYK